MHDNCTLKYSKNFFRTSYKKSETFQQYYKNKINEMLLYLRKSNKFKKMFRKALFLHLFFMVIKIADKIVYMREGEREEEGLPCLKVA
jgi:hypothetical protein